MLFTFFCFSVEIPFLGKLGPKNQNCHFMLKFGTYTNPNMQNSMVMFIFSVFDWKYPFWANLAQKVKIISWSWNFVPRLIRICRIHWCCSRFLFSTGNTLFGQICSKKIKIFNLRWKLILRLIPICRIQWWCSLFLFAIEMPFLGKFGPKCQNYHFNLKLVTQTNSNM